VYSVRTIEDDLWVQMGLVGPETHALLLRVDRSADGSGAMMDVESWLSNEQAREGRFLDVAKLDALVRRAEEVRVKPRLLGSTSRLSDAREPLM
jgi:hypothetical protein